MTSGNREEVSQITIEFELTRDVDAAANDVRDRVSRARGRLPDDIEEPIISKVEADANAIVWLAFYSDRHDQLQITDYADRYVKDRLSALPGVSNVIIGGERRYAMRIWLDKDRLAARQLTVQDVEAALRNQNVEIPSGRIESAQREFSVRTRGDLTTPDQFNQLILGYIQGYPIRLQDVGFAELGAEDDRNAVRVNGRPAVGLGVVKQSKANTLAVADAIKAELTGIEQSLPDSMKLEIAYDSSIFIDRSIHEVYVTMGIALALVVTVTFIFLRSFRATTIPAVAIPASIISTFTIMYALGFSINVLTLLGLVLAIGLVVDDAIVVLENIHRRIEQGQTAMHAAIEGSHEIGFAVVATTISLVTVFVPIAFMTGTTGRLFSEFGLAVAGSVLISGFIALTLTPMMSAKILNVQVAHTWFFRATERLFDGMNRIYRRLLTAALRWRIAVIGLGVLASVASYFLFASLKSEFAPVEDRGIYIGVMIAPEGSTLAYTDAYARRVEDLYEQVPEIDKYFMVIAPGLEKPNPVTNALSFTMLKDWDERDRSQQQVVAELAPKMFGIPGFLAFPINPPSLGQNIIKTPVQFVIGGPTYEALQDDVTKMLDRVRPYPGLVNLDTDLKLNKPELNVNISRSKAADVGVSVAAIGRTLETLLGGREVTTFKREGEEYDVIVKLRDQDRTKPSDLSGLYVRGNQGALVQLSNFVTVQETVAPRELNHYDKMRSATITANLAPGYTLGEVLTHLEQTAKDVLPPGTRITYAGESKEFKEATGSLYITFGLAILIIYLVLAAQFESFVHPFTILLSVPLAVTGALLSLKLTGSTLNVYSQIGMIMLVGLVSKNAILIVEFANQLRERGRALVDAIIEASTLRLRPILMTTAAMILGAVPLAIATGAGAESRRQLGFVIVGGLLFSTLLTLFIVPAVYTLLARRQAGAKEAASAQEVHKAGAAGIAMLALVWFTGSTLGPAQAAEPVTDLPELRLSLRDAIDAALDNNPAVQRFREKVLEAKGFSDTRRGALLPNISGVVSQFSRTFNLGAFGIPGAGVVGPFDPFDARANMVLSIFNLSLLERWRAGRLGVEVAELDAEANKRDIMATVGLLYTEALRAEAAVKASESNIDLNQQLLKLAQDRKAAGMATGLDVTRAQVQLENEKQRLLVAENQRGRTKLNLIRAIGINFELRLILIDELKLVEVEPQSPYEALQAARENRIELRAQEQRQRLAQLTLSSIQSERIPSLRFDGDYGFIGLGPDEALPTRNVGVTLSVPIFDGGQREARISESRSQVRQEQIRMKDVSDQISLEVRDALLTLGSTKQQVLVAQEGLRLALRELDLSRERFAVGVANNIEVTNAQTSVARARDNMIEALANFNSARINLARAKGELKTL
jgi:multidrug efflux pump